MLPAMDPVEHARTAAAQLRALDAASDPATVVGALEAASQVAAGLASATLDRALLIAMEELLQAIAVVWQRSTDVVDVARAAGDAAFVVQQGVNDAYRRLVDAEARGSEGQ